MARNLQLELAICFKRGTIPAFVKDVLGEGRYELFKSGKISLDSMISVDGSIKSLAELA